jgi:hypothetical protein
MATAMTSQNHERGFSAEVALLLGWVSRPQVGENLRRRSFLRNPTFHGRTVELVAVGLRRIERRQLSATLVAR